MESIHRRSLALVPLLRVTLFGLPLITPLLRWTAVPCTHDGHLHYHRIAAMRYAWENGVYFTRWLPDLAFGYGYPFFVYREPFPLYSGLFLHLLGLPLPAASNVIYIVSILAAGWFTYLWVRDVMGSRAGIVAAVAYMAAPYVLIDALVRGNLPESLALALFPFLLWSGRRWLLCGSTRTFLVSVLGLAALALSHNISLLLFTPVLFLYLLAVGVLHGLRWRQVAIRLVLLFGLGLGMAVFYVAGALLEMDQVTLEQSTTTRNNDFRFNFTSLSEIFSPVSAEDPTLLNPPLPFRLGWVPLLLAGIGLLILFRSPLREQRWHAGLMGLGVTAFLFMSLSISQPLWEALPLIDFVQFPWRFVGRAALPVAFLAGAPFASIGVGEFASRKDSSRFYGLKFTDYGLQFVLLASLTLLLLEALPNLYPNICVEEAFPTINDVHSYERETGLVGVDPEGSYFPRTVQERPRQSTLEASYQNGEAPQRFDPAVLPEGAMIHAADYEPLAATVHLSSPEPFVARYLSFDFPGWAAWLDGERVPIVPSDPEGLITFAVAPGEHVLTVRWQSTPLRTSLLGLSLLSLVGVVVTAMVASEKLQVAGNKLQVASDHLHPVTGTLLITGLVLLALKLLVVDRSETLLRRAAAPPVTNSGALQARELRLAGYNLSQDSVAAGDTFDIDLAWVTVAPPTADYQSNVWLAGPGGLVWSEKETERPRLYEDAPRTRFWQPGQWGWDSREVRVLSGTPPGEYDIVLTLFDLATLQPLTLVGTDGLPIGPTAVIGRITVEAPTRPIVFRPQFSRRESVSGAGITLLGFNQDRAEAIPGEPVLLTLFWERGADLAEIPVTLELVNESGSVEQEWELSLLPAGFGFEKWQRGQGLRSQHLLRLPAHLNDGTYRFLLASSISLGEIAVNAPERAFNAPEVERVVQATFTDRQGNPQATLVGYTQASPSNFQPLTLVWQSEAEFATSFHVFVHLVDNSGQIVAQSDGEPAGWSRPTTSWVVGEYIIDEHQLFLPKSAPDGPLHLRVGLYNPVSGERLLFETAEFIVLPLPAEVD